MHQCYGCNSLVSSSTVLLEAADGRGTASGDCEDHSHEMSDRHFHELEELVLKHGCFHF